MIQIKSLNTILVRAEKLLNAGNMKKAYEISKSGIEECALVNKELNEQTQGWDLKKAFDYKGNYKIQGKKLELWMSKFWEILESTGIEPIVDEYETEMIEYDVYNNIIPAHLRGNKDTYDNFLYNS